MFKQLNSSYETLSDEITRPVIMPLSLKNTSNQPSSGVSGQSLDEELNNIRSLFQLSSSGFTTRMLKFGYYDGWFVGCL